MQFMKKLCWLDLMIASKMKWNEIFRENTSFLHKWKYYIQKKHQYRISSSLIQLKNAWFNHGYRFLSFYVRVCDGVFYSGRVNGSTVFAQHNYLCDYVCVYLNEKIHSHTHTLSIICLKLCRCPSQLIRLKRFAEAFKRIQIHVWFK